MNEHSADTGGKRIIGADTDGDSYSYFDVLKQRWVTPDLESQRHMYPKSFEVPHVEVPEEEEDPFQILMDKAKEIERMAHEYQRQVMKDHIKQILHTRAWITPDSELADKIAEEIIDIKLINGGINNE